MAKLTSDDLLKAIEDMSVLELKEFLDAFEEKFDVTAAAPVAVAAPTGGGEEASGGRVAAPVFSDIMHEIYMLNELEI